MRTSTRLPALAFAMALTGCAAAASAPGMIPTNAEIVRPSNPNMAGAVGVEAVGGGEETNPMWSSQVGNAEFKQALVTSLRLAGLLAEGPARYSLKAMLVKLQQPVFGFDMTVVATVQYVVTDASGGVAWSETITTSHTATTGEAFVGATRLKLANEGAVRKNIAQLVQKLGAAPLPGAAGLNVN